MKSSFKLTLLAINFGGTLELRCQWEDDLKYIFNMFFSLLLTETRMIKRDVSSSSLTFSWQT